jgi:hypothetical protein
MATSPHLRQLRAVPAFGDCSAATLACIAALVDTIEVPAGTLLDAHPRELRFTMEPTKVLVVDRRALSTVLQLAPPLMERMSDDPPQCVAASHRDGTHDGDLFQPARLADRSRR